MSTNISKKKRDDLLDKIKQIRAFIAAAPQDENTGNLLSYLSELEKDVNGKKYGLVFEEHREEIDEVLDTHTPVLTEDADLFIDHGVQMNFLIEGDNLASLQLLEKTHKGKIDLIYIDPPYNTGAKDFVYDDAFVDTTDGFNHSKWLSFMKQRLSLSKKLLAAHGTIFISIDDNEFSQLKLLCDEVFGANNYVGTILWKKKTNGNNMGWLPPVHDYILCYSKEIGKIYDFGFEVSEEDILKNYSNPDNDPRGPWTTTDLSANHKGPYFPVTNPKTGDVYYPPAGRYWVFNEQEIQRRIADGRIIFGKSGMARPVQRVFAKDRKFSKRKVESWWDNHGMNADATQKYGEDYTPMQASILEQIEDKHHFSFSAPTSTGKSFVFRNLIRSASNDVVVIVPSRALINEYYDRIREIVNVKEVNVLTFVDRINTKFAKRNIFILTPERSRELFKNKSWLNIDLILFDEAQLSDEKSVRGLYFDSIVRRALKSFPDAKYVFAHPFISNPEAQLERNGIIDTQSAAINYEQKNVGQIFYVHNPATGDFYHLGTSKEILGKQKLKAEFDPIERAISSGGSVLIYVSKSHIYNKSIYSEFDKYIKLCNKLEKPDALQMIDELRSYIGASKNNALFYNSEMLEKLSLGIVTHHGSMPLAARLILEHFTQSGFCRICFATSTLEQGINMPFDVVYLDKFEASKSLSVKNLIGRAGRSTVDAKFDYGSVVIRNNAITSLRRVMRKAEPLSKISNLDVTDDSLDEKYKEFKEAINTGAFSDEYNLPSADVEKLHSDDVTAMIPQLLDMMFDDGDIISPNTDMKEVNDLFSKLYQQYLGRKLCQAEKSVLSTAVKIMIWKIYGKTFHRICQYRYAYASRTAERQQLYRKRNAEEANSIPAKYIVGYHDIPDKDLTAYPLVSTSIAAKDVDYDLIVYDTYDYLDKLIGFKLSDIFYAIFYQYYEATSDERALRLAKYFKYGTDKEREIWMLRYGFSFEEIEWVSECVDSIDETEIKFNDKINALDDAQLKSIEQYVHE